MQSIRYKFIELVLIFIVIPISFLLNYSPILKLIIGVLGFTYVIYILLKVEKNKFSINKNNDWKNFWKSTLIKLFVIVVVTSVIVLFTDSKNLFNVVLNKPMLWVLILLFYSLFSVFPQELIYRTFFFQRYHKLFKNEYVFILINAALFSLAHILFKSYLVLIFTFIGGLLFAITYQKTNSTLLVSIEHAIYGCWLFTVGMGTMLGFPS